MEKISDFIILTSKRSQLAEMRKRILAQIRAHKKLGVAAMFEDVDTELKQRIDSLSKELGNRITRAIASDESLSEAASAKPENRTRSSASPSPESWSSSPTPKARSVKNGSPQRADRYSC